MHQPLGQLHVPGYANLVGDKSLPTSRTEPQPELQTGKNRFFSVNPIRT